MGIGRLATAANPFLRAPELVEARSDAEAFGLVRKAKDEFRG